LQKNLDLRRRISPASGASESPSISPFRKPRELSPAPLIRIESLYKFDPLLRLLLQSAKCLLEAFQPNNQLGKGGLRHGIVLQGNRIWKRRQGLSYNEMNGYEFGRNLGTRGGCVARVSSLFVKRIIVDAARLHRFL